MRENSSSVTGWACCSEVETHVRVKFEVCLVVERDKRGRRKEE